MTNTIEVIIPKDIWICKKKLHRVRLPFNCTKEDDVIISILDGEKYIKRFQGTYDSLNNGTTFDGFVELTANRKPRCDMQIRIEKVM